jgi:hypothetical protein
MQLRQVLCDSAVKHSGEHKAGTSSQHKSRSSNNHAYRTKAPHNGCYAKQPQSRDAFSGRSKHNTDTSALPVVL